MSEIIETIFSSSLVSLRLLMKNGTKVYTLNKKHIFTRKSTYILSMNDIFTTITKFVLLVCGGGSELALDFS